MDSRELTVEEIACVSGALTWGQRYALSGGNPGALFGILLVEGVMNSYQAGWDGAHGRANQKN